MQAQRSSEQQFLIQNSNTRVELSNGSTLIDTETLTALIHNGNLIETWPSLDWAFLAVDQQERFAFFEAHDSWLIAVLNLQTGEWIADDDPLFVHYSLDEDSEGPFIREESSELKHYLKF